METQLNAPGLAASVTNNQSRVPKAVTLTRKPRPFESFISITLFLCGAVSILTTLGIVLVLGSESLRLFTQYAWTGTQNSLATPLAAETATFEVSAGGHTYKTNEIVRVGEELMRVISFDVATREVTVERAIEGSTAVAHPEAARIDLGTRATIIDFLTKTKWQPQLGEFGILPLLSATLMTSFIAMLVAIPLGLGAAIYLSEYASLRVRSTIKPILELLAGVPTVVYGYFALTFMTPLLRAIFGVNIVNIYNMASAGIVMGIMIIPTISSMSEDALSSVPRSLREASYGLGATRLETSFRVLVPAALSGIIAAFILGVSRAVGETMIVAIAAGAGPNFTLNPFESAETMTGHIARISTGDISFGSIDYNSLFSIGLTLFLLTLVLNLISNSIIRRFRQVYA